MLHDHLHSLDLHNNNNTVKCEAEARIICIHNMQSLLKVVMAQTMNDDDPSVSSKLISSPALLLLIYYLIAKDTFPLGSSNFVRNSPTASGEFKHLPNLLWTKVDLT